MKMSRVKKRIYKPVFKWSAALAAAVFLLLHAAQPAHTAYAESIQENSVQGNADNTENVENSNGETTEESSVDNKQGGETASGTGRSVYTDSQGITYILDGNACYVSGYTEAIASSVVLPEQLEAEGSTYTVKGIQKQAFSKCRKLKKIEIPNNVDDVEKGVFSGCSSLATISIVPVKYSIKGNGKTCTASIRISSILLGESDNVCLKIHRDLIEAAAAQKGTDTIVISVKAAGGDGAYALPEQLVFDADAAKALSKCGKTLKVTLTDTNREKNYIMLDKSRLKQAGEGLKLKLLKQKTGSTSGNLKSDLKKALKKNGIQENNAQVFQLSFGNSTNTGAEIVLPVKSINTIKAGSPVYVYRYSTSKRDFLTVLYHPASVSKLGNLRLSLDKGGIYILSAKPFRYMCRKLADTFITESGSTYYIDHSGQAVCGWKKLGQSYYYFDRENGKMASGCTIDGIRLTKSGQAAADADVPKIQTMIKARNIVLQITNPEDTLEQKIRQSFLWIFQFPYKRYRSLSPIYRQAGWEVTFANDIFDRHQGCCVSEASATAFLFHECGCKTVYVATDTGHAWVELNGRVYDPLFAEARGFDNYYNRPYAGYGMYAVVKHKI